MPERNIAVSAADLALTIAKKASGVFVSRTLPYHRQFFFMFESAIADFVCVEPYSSSTFYAYTSAGMETDRIVGALSTKLQTRGGAKTKEGKEEQESGSRPLQFQEQKCWLISCEV
jgi:hypothetical protein